MQLVKSISFYLVSVALGLLFLFSAYTKLIDIEPFEWTIAETGWFSFGVANILSRVLIIAEFFIGCCLLLGFSWQRKIYSIAAILLLIFNLYLLYVLFSYGNDTNCGCFGKAVYFTPVQATIKNLLTIALLFYLSKFNINNFKNYTFYFLVTAIGLSIGITFYKEPLDMFVVNLKDKPMASKELKLNSIAKELPFNYMQGKHIISVLSLHCVFCKKAARKMHSMLLQNNKLPLHIIYGGDSNKLGTFIKETFSQNVPYTFTKDEPTLIEISEGSFPTILWVQDGRVIKKSSYFTLNTVDIQNWINKK